MAKEKFAVIVDALRSPIGVKNGKMIGMRPDDLSAQVVKALLERNKNLPVEKIEDVVLGCAFPEGTQGMLMARGVARGAIFFDDEDREDFLRRLGEAHDRWGVVCHGYALRSMWRPRTH